MSKKIDICSVCMHEDFGYCGLRNKEIELKYENDEDSELIKCSGFICDKSSVERIFKIKEDDNCLKNEGK
jgi:hypothetical protein